MRFEAWGMVAHWESCFEMVRCTLRSFAPAATAPVRTALAVEERASCICYNTRPEHWQAVGRSQIAGRALLDGEAFAL